MSGSEKRGGDPEVAKGTEGEDNLSPKNGKRDEKRGGKRNSAKLRKVSENQITHQERIKKKPAFTNAQRRENGGQEKRRCGQGEANRAAHSKKAILHQSTDGTLLNSAQKSNGIEGGKGERAHKLTSCY